MPHSFDKKASDNKAAENESAGNESPANAGATPRATSKVRYVEAGEGDVGQRIDNFLIRILKDVPRSAIYRIMRKGEVRVNARRAKPDYRLVEGDRVRIPPVRVHTERAPATPSRSLRDFVAGAIVHEDRDLIVINKPAGVAVHGGSGLSFGVIEALRASRPDLTELELVHRLDRETSGCLLIAKRRAVLREMHALFREREIEKHYFALVAGRWPFGKKRIELPLETNQRQGGERVVRVHADGQDAVSTFRPVQTFGRIATLLDVEIGTGRTHQIRVHARATGHPVAGDDKYGDREKDASLTPFGLTRMFLHARSLSFTRASGEKVRFEAPLPEELQGVLDRLEAVAKR
jgi:23S rRNA pseudouridine955/2504/2580 synthase